MPSQELINELVGNALATWRGCRRFWLDHPELVNASSQWGETPIQAAAQMGDRAMAGYLLDLGAPLDICTAAMLGRSRPPTWSTTTERRRWRWRSKPATRQLLRFCHDVGVHTCALRFKPKKNPSPQSAPTKSNCQVSN